MAKYKIGDKVRVRDDLKYEDWYYMSASNETQMANDEMVEKAGQIVTIKDFDDSGCYYIKEDCWHWTDEMFSEKIEDKPSLSEYQIEHQHDIPKKLFYLAEKYPNVTWKKAKEYYARVVDNVILGAGEENLFSGNLSFGRGLKEAAARFEELLKLEEKAVSLKSTIGTIATFEGIPVFEGEMPNPVSDDGRASKKMDCFSCTSADCANCENFKYKMAIT